MKRNIVLLLLASFCATCVAQMPTHRKLLLIGSAITIGGAGTLASGLYMLPEGFKQLDNDEVLRGAGLVGGGCVLISIGLTGSIAGPIILAQGVKAKRREKDSTSYLIFTPIHNKLLDKYQGSNYSKKFASLSFLF